jgi:AraC-like DNA-binding protein
VTKQPNDGQLARPGYVAPPDVVPLIATLRISAAWSLPGVVRELGLDLDRLLADSNLPPDLFTNRENPVTYGELERLLVACEQQAQCDHFGFLIGERAGLADFGLAGQAALCASNVGEALREFISHFNLHNTAATVTLTVVERYAQFVYVVSEQGLKDTRHFQLGGIACSCNILRELCGPEWVPTVVRCASRSPSNLKVFQKFFGAPIEFDADESGIVFPGHWLSRPLPPTDPAFRRQVAQAVREQRATMLADFPATVRMVLRKQLQLGAIGMQDVAARLGMHRRTLDRHLQAQGVTFGELLESVRIDVACQLLHDTAMPIGQVADTLRYGSSASFATAFRRGTGLTPTSYRRRSLEPEPA